MSMVTSAAANKLIKTLEDEKSYYLSIEAESCVYTLNEGETVEKPEYDYETIQAKITACDEQIRKIRHAINRFNTTCVLPNLNITIDEALVKMAQLNGRKNILDQMRRRLPKTRLSSMMIRNNPVVEYQYVNYDIDKVNEDYKKISEEVIQIQLALDICNQTQTFEI